MPDQDYGEFGGLVPKRKTVPAATAVAGDVGEFSSLVPPKVPVTTTRGGGLPSSMKGRLGATGTLPNENAPLDPMAGFGIQDQTTKQPVNPKKVQQDRIVELNRRLAMGDVSAQAELLQIASTQPQTRAKVATKKQLIEASYNEMVTDWKKRFPNQPITRDTQKVFMDAAKRKVEAESKPQDPNRREVRAMTGSETRESRQRRLADTAFEQQNPDEAQIRQIMNLNPRLTRDQAEKQLAMSKGSGAAAVYGANKVAKDIAEAVKPIVKPLAEIGVNASPLGVVTKGKAGKLSGEVAPDLVGAIATIPVQFSAEIMQITDPNVSVADKAKAGANIIANTLPVEAFGVKIIGKTGEAAAKALDDLLLKMTKTSKEAADAAVAMRQALKSGIKAEDVLKNLSEVKKPSGLKIESPTIRESQTVPKAKEGFQDPLFGSKKVEPASVPAQKPTEIIETTPVETVPVPVKPKTSVEPDIAVPPTKPAVPPVADVEPPIPKKQPKPLTPAESSKGKTIGLANQTEFKMAQDGRIEPVDPGVGRKFGVAQEEGRKAVESGAIDPYKLASELETKPRPIDYKEVGALLEGARRLENEVNRISDTLPGLKGKALEDAFSAHEAARDTLNEFLRKAQKGKTELSDAFRALQEGSELDTGNLAQVIQKRARRVGEETIPTDSPEYKKIAKEVKDLQDSVKQIVPDYDPAKETVDQALNRWRKGVTDLDRAKAESVVRSVSRGSMSRKTPEALQKARADATKRLTDRIKKLREPGGVGGNKQRGSAYSPFRELLAAAPEIIDDIKVIVKTLAEEFKVRRLDKAFFDKVRAEVPNIDITDDEIVKALAGVWDDVSAKQPSFYEKLTKQARKIESTTVKDSRKRLADATKRMKEWEAKPGAIDAAEAKQMRETLARGQKLADDIERDAARSVGKESDLRSSMIAADNRKRLAEINKNLKKTEDRLDKLADLEDQIETGGFWESAPKIKKLTKAQERLDLEIQLKQLHIKNLVRERDMGAAEKALRFATSTLRSTTLGGDVGVVARQGLRAWAKPLIAAKNVGEGFKAMLSDANLLKLQNELRHREINGVLAEPIRRRSGLSVTTHFGDQEEYSLGKMFRWFGKMGGKAPGVVGRVLKEIPGGLDRFQSAFINGVRTDFFDYGIRHGWSQRELTERAEYINAIFGRSNLKSVHPIAEAIMTSPRYEASRWETLYRLIRDPAAAVASGGKNKAANEAVKEMGVMLAGVFGVMKLAEAKGYELNFDPTSSDFLKMRKGNEVWDVTAGLGPRFRDIARSIAAIDDPSRRNLQDLGGNIVVRTLSPGVRVPAEQISYARQRQRGAPPDQIKSPFSGFEPDTGREGWLLALPLIATNTNQALQEQGFLAGLDAFWKEAIGTSVNRYEKPKPTTPKYYFDDLGRVYDREKNRRDSDVLKVLKEHDIQFDLPRRYEGESDSSLHARGAKVSDAVATHLRKVLSGPKYKGERSRTARRELLMDEATKARQQFYDSKEHSQQLEKERASRRTKVESERASAK